MTVVATMAPKRLRGNKFLTTAIETPAVCDVAQYYENKQINSLHVFYSSTEFRSDKLSYESSMALIVRNDFPSKLISRFIDIT